MPRASGGSHIKIDATSTSADYLYSPVIDCSNYTKGTLKFGVWRAPGYDKTLFVSLDLNGDNLYNECKYLIPPDSISKTETWVLYSINLKDTINNKPNVKIRFSQSSATNYSGPIRIDDITLYAYTSTLATDHFRTRGSGNWNIKAVWESSHDNVTWEPSGLTPTNLASSITIRNTHHLQNTGSLTADQLTIQNGGSLILVQDIALNDGPGEDLIVEEGGLLDVATYHLTGAGTIQLNGHLKTANPNGLCGSAATSLTNGISLNTPGAHSVVEYNAGGNQNISPQLLYANLFINGSGDKLLTGPTTVSNNLQIHSGHLVLETHQVVVGNTVTNTPPSYVKINGAGKLTIRNIGSNPKIFPIGNTTYNPVSIAGGSGLEWTVGIEDAWTLALPVLGTERDKSIHRTWSITPSTNPPQAAPTITFEYNDNDPAQTGSGFNKDSPIMVWRQAEDSWLVVGEVRYPGTSATGTKTATMLCSNQFSLFAISNPDMPLPVRFRNVSARQQQRTVVISFTNETESGVEHYSLERSVEGHPYSSLQVIHPLKNDGTSVSYEIQDASPPEALNLYRIKAVEKSGAILYSPVISINIKENEARITVVPNPAHGSEVSLQLSNVPQDTYIVKLYNTEGQVLQQQTLKHAGGSASVPLRVEGLRPGTYLLELYGKEKLLQRFIVL